ncbi:MAG: ABC transporter ATP-binding protein [Spirochaetae bacterium HGW-Spirochaetae-7]|jgi:branched-chain amino acid transport system ATP-binding protein|nr:MAG: ABC transporter ATP-binding protein [Spirochaetae bacterium HGW-Spirochaetae-7]
MPDPVDILATTNVVKRFGGLTAVNKMSFTIRQGCIYSIIGPNGAGKTTFFNTISGLYKPEEGSILFDGHRIEGQPPEKITALHMARTFQNIRLFGGMTVVENILVGAYTRLKQSSIQAVFRTRAFLDEEKKAESRAEELMEYVGLYGVGNELAASLPYGAQRRVEIARALASEPKLLLLDEPTAGMNPSESADALQLFRRLRDDLGITILLIEHDMKVVMNVSERITVMDYGEKIAEGTPKEIAANPRVIEAYLGRGAAAAMTA